MSAHIKVPRDYKSLNVNFPHEADLGGVPIKPISTPVLPMCMCEVLADRRWSNPAGGTVTRETPARILRTEGPGCVIMITKYVGVLLQQEIGEEVDDLCYIDLLVDS